MPLLIKKCKPLILPAAIGTAVFIGVSVATTGVQALAAPSIMASPSGVSASAEVPTIKIGTIPSVRGPSDLTLPIDRYRRSSAARAITTEAINKYAGECSEKYGINFTTPVIAQADDPYHAYYRLFGLVDIDAAKKWGYHTGAALLSNGEAVPTASEEAEADAAADPAYRAVVFGDTDAKVATGTPVPASGCIAQARDRVNEAFDDDALLEQAMNYGLEQSDADSRVRAGVTLWSKCMAVNGFSYASPQEANNDGDWSGTIISDEEIATAVADVNCKASTGLTGLRVAVASAWINKFVGARIDSFTAIAGDRAGESARAEAILDSKILIP